MFLLLFPFQTQHYIHHRDHHYVFFFHYFHVTKKRVILIKKKRPVKTWVKISKVMPQPNSPIPPGKGGIPYGKKSKSFGQNMVQLNHTHLFLHFFKIYKQNFSNLRFVFWQNFQRIIHILRNSPQNPTNNAKFTPFIHYTLYFQMPDHQQRTL